MFDRQRVTQPLVLMSTVRATSSDSCIIRYQYTEAPGSRPISLTLFKNGGRPIRGLAPQSSYRYATPDDVDSKIDTSCFVVQCLIVF